MTKVSQPVWVKRIYKLLTQAQKTDCDFARFGAYKHQYRLAATVSEEKIAAFEQQYHIRLPEEYRDFLRLVGNGGAGPYYGLYGLADVQKELAYGRHYAVQKGMVTYPKMGDREWERIVRLADDKEQLYAGILPIGSQGCTLMTGLALSGEQRGQVVYFDLDYGSKPFFVREKGFLAWYERWLREVVAGYDEGIGFGYNLDGNPAQLMAAYEQCVTVADKKEIISSFYKFEKLPQAQQVYFKQVCTEETDMAVRVGLIKLLSHFRVPKMTKEIDKLWAYGAYAEAVSIISYEGTWDVKEAWYHQVLEKLPELQGEGFRDACYIIKAMQDYPDVNAGLLQEALRREDLGKNERSTLFYCLKDLRGKEAVVDYFLTYLPQETDCHLLIYALQAIHGVQDERLRAIYIQLLNRYRTHENAWFDYKGSQMMLKGGCCMGASRPEGQVVSNLMAGLDYFGLDYRGAWKLLMDDGRWRDWQVQQVGI